MKELLFKLSAYELLFLKLDEIDAGPHPMYYQAFIPEGMKQMVQAYLLRDTSAYIRKEEIGQRVYNIAHEMMISATSGIKAGFDDGDICPPYFPWHFPHHYFDLPTQLGDRLNQSSIFSSSFLFEQMEEMKPIILAEALRINAALTISQTFNRELIKAALELAQTALSQKAFAEFEERCGNTPPRLPLPGKRFQQTEEIMEMAG